MNVVQLRLVGNRAWFKKCRFQVTPKIDKTLVVKGFLVLGVTLSLTFRILRCMAEGVRKSLQEGGRDLDGLRAGPGHG